MPRPARVLDWTGPTRRQVLTARFEALWAELGKVQAELLTLPTEQSAPPPADVFLKASDAAARFGWHADTIRRWAASGRIRSVGSGGRVRVSTADLAAMQRLAPAARAAPGRAAGEG